MPVLDQTLWCRCLDNWASKRRLRRRDQSRRCTAWYAGGRRSDHAVVRGVWALGVGRHDLSRLEGLRPINAVTIVAEVGDFSRFSNPRQLMAYFGLAPSEHSSGGAVRRGGITKAGNLHARSARRSLDLPYAGTSQPEAVRSAGGGTAERVRHCLDGADS